MKKSIFSLLVILISFPLLSQIHELQENWWIPHGIINTIKKDSVNNTVFIGGGFNYVGPSENYGTEVDINNGIYNSTIANPDGTVIASIGDGTGGWYISGFFTKVGDSSRTYVAHINSSGNVSSWNPMVNSQVNTFCISGTTLFLGGNFTEINGQSRNSIASFDLITGNLNPWNPEINGGVNTIVLDGTIIYVGGGFDSINGQLRNNIAAFDLSTGGLTAWNPDVNSNVKSVTYNSNSVFILGNFTSVNGTPRNRIAELDKLTGQTLNLDISHNAFDLYSIAAFDTILYVGGWYTYMGGESRNNLAAININTGLSTSWNPNPSENTEIQSLQINNNYLYVGGSFETIEGAFQSGLAKFDLLSGAITNWKPNAYLGRVYSLSIDGSKVYVGGDFKSINGLNRNCVVELDLVTGQPTNWSSNINRQGNVYDIIVSDSTLYVCGLFDTINGVNRNNLAEISKTNGLPTAWDPNVNGTVKCIQANNTSVFIGGEFTSVGSENRNFFSEINRTNGLATTWNPDLDSTVSIMLLNDSILYIAGEFHSVDGFTRNYVASLNFLSQTLTNWNPDPNNLVYDFLINGDSIYLVGAFTDLGFEARNCIGFVDKNSGNLSPFNLNSLQGYAIMSIAKRNSMLYLAGYYYEINSSLRNNVATFDLNSNNIESWNPNPDNGVNKIRYIDNYIFAAGSFETISNKKSFQFAVFTGCPVVSISSFVLPSDINLCTGSQSLTVLGNPDFEISIDGTAPFSSSGYSLQSNLCPGIHELSVIDFCGNIVTQQFVIPVDSNYIFNNPFIDSIALDSLGTTITNCDIYYNSIDTAYIDSLWATGNQVNVIWNIVDSNGSNLDTTTYDLMNGSGVYWLQLSVFCPTKAVDDYFTVTQAIYFGNGGAYLVGLEDNPVLENSIGLYPNPTSNSVTVTFTSSSTARVQLIDAQGKFIQESTINSGDQISLDYLDRGVYLLNVEMDGKSICKKIIKQ